MAIYKLPHREYICICDWKNVWLSLNYSLSLFRKQPKNLFIHYWIIPWKNTFQLQTKISEKAWQNLVKSRIFFLDFLPQMALIFLLNTQWNNFPMNQYFNFERIYPIVLMTLIDAENRLIWDCCSHWKYSWFYIASVYWSLEEHCWGKSFSQSSTKALAGFGIWKTRVCNNRMPQLDIQRL